MNAKKELLQEIGSRDVKYVAVRVQNTPRYYDPEINVVGTLEEVLPQLDFEYDDGFGGQKLFGTIWYTDGTWSARAEYDGSEWWEHRSCPPLPDIFKKEVK